MKEKDEKETFTNLRIYIVEPGILYRTESAFNSQIKYI